MEKNKYAQQLKSAQQELEEVSLQKNRFVKLFKQTQAKMVSLEKSHTTGKFYFFLSKKYLN